MAGIYIPNMKMPKKGHCEIVIIHNDSEVCDFYTRDKISNAIEVLEHGRLIDADAMRSSMPPCYTMEEIVKAFKNAPTVIPADKDGA